MTTYRWTSTTRLKRHDSGEEIQPGDTFKPTESELRAFGDHIEEIDVDESDDDGDSENEDGGENDDVDADDEVPFDETAWFDDHDRFEDRISTVESGDVDAILDAIEDVETSENVIDAINERRDELEE